MNRDSEQDVCPTVADDSVQKLGEIEFGDYDQRHLVGQLAKNTRHSLSILTPQYSTTCNFKKGIEMRTITYDNATLTV
jgi:hypothetical protein